jgi:cytochrome b involved in lipid metabolism
LFTFGEGYHNYHHEFQHDYRNGVKPWNWDPTKWIIWTLAKLRLVNGLRRVPKSVIQSAQSRVETQSGHDWAETADLAGAESTRSQPTV